MRGFHPLFMMVDGQHSDTWPHHVRFPCRMEVKPLQLDIIQHPVVTTEIKTCYRNGVNPSLVTPSITITINSRRSIYFGDEYVLWDSDFQSNISVTWQSSFDSPAFGMQETKGFQQYIRRALYTRNCHAMKPWSLLMARLYFYIAMEVKLLCLKIGS